MKPTRRTTAPLLAIASITLTACVSSPPSDGPGREATQHRSDAARDPLAAQAEAERSRDAAPDDRARSAAARHINRLTERFAIGPDDPKPRTTLERSLLGATERYLASEEHAAPPAGAATDTARADELLDAARERLAAGDPENAIATLRRALEADPSNTAAWRTLGLAAADTENRPLARAALKSAFDLGDRDPRALGALATLAREGELNALAVAAIAQRINEPSADAPAPRTLITLAEALDAQGFVLAAAQARTRAAKHALDDPLAHPTAARAAPRLLVDAGDRLLALGRHQTAANAFRRAMDTLRASPHAPAVAIAAAHRRLAWTHLAAGRPANATRSLLDAIEANGNTPNADDAAIINALADVPGIAAPLDERLAALEQAADTGTGSARVAWAIARAAAATDPAGFTATLARPFNETPHDDTLLVAVLATLETATPAERDAAVARLAASAPWRSDHVLRAAIDALGPQTLSTVAAEPQPGTIERADATAAALAADRLSRKTPIPTDRTRAILEAAPNSLLALTLHAQALADAGRPREADRLVATATNREPLRNDPRAALVAAAWHLERNDPRAALTAARQASNTATNDAHHNAALLLTARAHLAAGDHDAALSALERLINRVPSHAKALVIRYQTLERTDADPERLADAAAAINANAPGSHAERWLEARRLAGERRTREARAAIQRIIDAPAPPDEALITLTDLLLETNDPAAAEDTLTTLTETRPHRPLHTALLIRALAAQGRADEALRLARDHLDRWPASDTVARAAQTAARAGGGSAQTWARFVRHRLDLAPETLATAAEQALLDLTRNNPAAATLHLTTAANNLQAQIARPLPVERRLLDQAANAAAASLGRLNGPEQAQLLNTIDAIDRVAQSLPASARFVQLQLAATHDNPPDPDRLAAIFLALDNNASNTFSAAAIDNAAANAALALLARAADDAATDRRENPHAATALELLATAAETLPPDALESAAVRLIAGVVYHDPDAVADAARPTIERNTFPALLRTAAARYQDRPDPDELALALARQAASILPDEHFDTAEHIYRFVLAQSPNDPQASNSLGYRLLERNERIDEAAALIEQAHAALPDSPAVTDSLGWARYKQGIFTDTTNDRGETTRGAITILARALRLAQNPRDPNTPPDPATAAVVADHLADALWRAGRREQAIQRWQQAAALADTALNDPENPLPRGPGRDEVAAVAANAPAKIRDAENDRTPRLAPVPPQTAEQSQP